MMSFMRYGLHSCEQYVSFERTSDMYNVLLSSVGMGDGGNVLLI